MKKFEQYRFRDGVTMLNERELNDRFFDIDSRIHEIETVKSRLDESIQGLINVGIERIDEAISPKIGEAAQALADFRADAQAEFSLLEQALLDFQASANQWLSDLQALYEIFQDPVLELSELQEWKGRLDPHGDSVIRPDKLRGGTTTITYDEQGRVSQMSTALPYGTYHLIYAYDANGNVQTETAKLNTTTLWSRTYQYDGNGNITGWTEG